MIKKIIVVTLILGAVVLFQTLGLGDYLTLEYLKQQQANFAAIYADHPLLLITGYFFLYVGVTALSLPGAVVMTLAGGGFFGLITGTLVISFASTIGATLACLAARYLFRDWVQQKFGDKLEKFNQGMEKEGGFYLFSLRLVPLFPFFVINLVMGLTSIRMSTYYWVSQLGMLPATIVYVNAGKELAKIESLAGILSPSLIGSFALLGLLPVATKKILGLYASRRAASAKP